MTTKGRPRGLKYRLMVTYRSTGETQYFDTYEDVAKKVGVTAATLRVYLTHGRGVTYRKRYDPQTGAEDVITVKRVPREE